LGDHSHPLGHLGVPIGHGLPGHPIWPVWFWRRKQRQEVFTFPSANVLKWENHEAVQAEAGFMYIGLPEHTDQMMKKLHQYTSFNFRVQRDFACHSKPIILFQRWVGL
jgi:hypothetical protein